MSTSETVRFGRYTLERRLAMGGMAEVFLGRIEGPSNFQKQVVIKRILPHLRDDPRFVDMFVDEARLAARFNHPKLVQVYELAKVENQYCVAMEYIEGKDLATIMAQSEQRSKQIPFSFACYVAAGVAEGLHYAHELLNDHGEPLRVVHRDVSPANIIVTAHGGVKLFDFGIAKHEDRSSKTKANTLKGKLSYMSPEQIRRKNVDRRSDIFSLGVVLYEMVTGERCLTGNSFMELLEIVGNARYRDPKELRSDLPDSLAQVFRKMLEADPEARYQDAAEVQHALERVMADVGKVVAADIAPFIEDLFDDKTDGRGINVPMPLMGQDSMVVSGPLADPTVVVDSDSYQKFLQQRSEQNRKSSGYGRKITPTPMRSGRRASISKTIATIAERLVQPRYWPTTLLIISLSLVLATSTLVVLYKAAIHRSQARQGQSLPRGGETGSDLQTGTLRILTQPSGASVYVNNKEREGQTPLTLTDLSVHRVHRLEIEKEGYESREHEVTLSPGRQTAVRIALTPVETAKAVLSITSEPSGAQIILNGESTGSLTPSSVDIDPNIDYAIELSLNAFEPKAFAVQLEPGEHAEQHITFTRQLRVNNRNQREEKPFQNRHLIHRQHTADRHLHCGEKTGADAAQDS